MLHISHKESICTRIEAAALLKMPDECNNKILNIALDLIPDHGAPNDPRVLKAYEQIQHIVLGIQNGTGKIDDYIGAISHHFVN